MMKYRDKISNISCTIYTCIHIFCDELGKIGYRVSVCVRVYVVHTQYEAAEGYQLAHAL